MGRSRGPDGGDVTLRYTLPDKPVELPSVGALFSSGGQAAPKRDPNRSFAFSGGANQFPNGTIVPPESKPVGAPKSNLDQDFVTDDNGRRDPFTFSKDKVVLAEDQSAQKIVPTLDIFNLKDAVNRGVPPVTVTAQPQGGGAGQVVSGGGNSVAQAPDGFKKQWYRDAFSSPQLVQGLTQNRVKTNPLPLVLDGDVGGKDAPKNSAAFVPEFGEENMGFTLSTTPSAGRDLKTLNLHLNPIIDSLADGQKITDFPNAEMNYEKQQLGDTKAALTDLTEKSDKKEEGKLSKSESQAKQIRRAVDDEKKLDTAIELARTAVETGRYGLAKKQAEKVLELDPGNSDATAIIVQSRNKDFAARDEKIAEEYKHNFELNRERADRFNIPHSEYLIYPEDWRQIAERTSKESRERDAKKGTGGSVAFEPIDNFGGAGVALQKPGYLDDHTNKDIQFLRSAGGQKPALAPQGVEFSGLNPNVLFGDFGDLRRLGAPTGFLQPHVPGSADSAPSANDFLKSFNGDLDVATSTANGRESAKTPPVPAVYKDEEYQVVIKPAEGNIPAVTETRTRKICVTPANATYETIPQAMVTENRNATVLSIDDDKNVNLALHDGQKSPLANGKININAGENLADKLDELTRAIGTPITAEKTLEEQAFRSRMTANQQAAPLVGRETELYKLRIGKMIETAKSLSDKGDYKAAEQMAQRILINDPLNAEAEKLKDQARVAASQNAGAIHEYRDAARRSILDVDEAQISTAPLIKYPDNWDAISKRTDVSIGRKLDREMETPPNLPFPGFVNGPDVATGTAFSQVGSIVNNAINFFPDNPETLSGLDPTNTVRQARGITTFGTGVGDNFESYKLPNWKTQDEALISESYLATPRQASAGPRPILLLHPRLDPNFPAAPAKNAATASSIFEVSPPRLRNAHAKGARQTRKLCQTPRPRRLRNAHAQSLRQAGNKRFARCVQR